MWTDIKRITDYIGGRLNPESKKVSAKAPNCRK